MLKWLIIVVNNIIMILLSVHWGACRVRAVLNGQHNDAVLMRKRLTQRLYKIKKFNLLLTLSDVIKRLVRIVWPGAISTGTANNGKKCQQHTAGHRLKAVVNSHKERQGQSPSQSPANLPHILIYGKYIHFFFSTIFHLFSLSVFIGLMAEKSKKHSMPTGYCRKRPKGGHLNNRG